MKRRNILFALIAFIALVGFAAFSRFDNVEADNTFAIGAKIDNFSLTDTSGKTQSFNDLKGKNGTVLVFFSAQCPVVKAYTGRMNEFAKDYQAKGVNLVGVNSNSTETVEFTKTTAAEREHTFPILIDKGNVLADKLAASYTPEVYFFNAQDELVYHGRIDNDRNGANVTENNLRDALDAVLSGKAVTKAEAKGFGCSIKRAEKMGDMKMKP